MCASHCAKSGRDFRKNCVCEVLTHVRQARSIAMSSPQPKKSTSSSNIKIKRNVVHQLWFDLHACIGAKFKAAWGECIPTRHFLLVSRPLLLPPCSVRGKWNVHGCHLQRVCTEGLAIALLWPRLQQGFTAVDINCSTERPCVASAQRVLDSDTFFPSRNSCLPSLVLVFLYLWLYTVGARVVVTPGGSNDAVPSKPSTLFRNVRTRVLGLPRVSTSSSSIKNF